MKRFILFFMCFLALSTCFAAPDPMRIVNASGLPITVTFGQSQPFEFPLANGSNTLTANWILYNDIFCKPIRSSCLFSFRVNGQRKAYAVINTETRTLVKIHSIHSMGLTAGYTNGKLSSLIFTK